MSIVTNLLSWSFAIGLLLGFLLSRVWEVVKVCRLDKRKPLPDGKKRSKWKAIAVDPRYFTALIAVCFLSWSVFTTQANTNDNKENAVAATEFAGRVQQCQAQLITAILDSRTVTARIEKVKGLSPESPVRQQYNVDVTRGFFNRAGEINTRIVAIHDEQARNDASRPAVRPALPDPDCGT